MKTQADFLVELIVLPKESESTSLVFLTAVVGKKELTDESIFMEYLKQGVSDWLETTPVGQFVLSQNEGTFDLEDLSDFTQDMPTDPSKLAGTLFKYGIKDLKVQVKSYKVADLNSNLYEKSYQL